MTRTSMPIRTAAMVVLALMALAPGPAPGVRAQAQVNLPDNWTFYQWQGSSTWTFTLTRQAPNVWSARSRNDQTGEEGTWTFTLVRAEGQVVVLERAGIGLYTGTVSSDGKTITGTCDFIGGGWSTFPGRKPPGAGGGTGLVFTTDDLYFLCRAASMERATGVCDSIKDADLRWFCLAAADRNRRSSGYCPSIVNADLRRACEGASGPRTSGLCDAVVDPDWRAICSSWYTRADSCTLIKDPQLRDLCRTANGIMWDPRNDFCGPLREVGGATTPVASPRLTADGYPSIAGEWTEAPYTVVIVQEAGGRFTATCHYDGRAWRTEGTISRDGRVEARLEHTLGVPSNAVGYAQRRVLTLSPDGQLLTGISTFEGGSHAVEWRRNPAK